METIILTFVVSLLAIAGLAVGVLAGRTPIKGSCGGLACHKGLSCGVCKAGRGKGPK
ncbi:MAG: hypothetical protein KJO30_00550 [Boseongicola sp.]|nr:hypothetical protein [Boseongicola sp.]NNJ67312.1 hypothetical protein [Boseongicola sp.]